jgi:hypothetical protein
MGQMMLVTLREGIEMFLIVAIAATYLRKTGRPRAAAGGALGHRDRHRGVGGDRNPARRKGGDTALGRRPVSDRRGAGDFDGDLHAQGGQAHAPGYRREARGRGRARRPRLRGLRYSCSSS